MKKILALSLCLFGLALLAPCRQHAQTVKPTHKRGRALLVGINRYQNFPSRPTPGSEEDAKATCDFLIERFGFERDEIQLLLADKATAQNIVAEFRRWLIDGTKPGDRVFFLYSGHGTRIPDDDGDEADKEDEALAPYDVTPNLGNLIRDDVFNELIGELQGRMAVMVFDSCHSGTISRDLPGSKSKLNKQEDQPKYLPLTELKTATRAIGGELSIGTFTEKEAQGRDLHLVVDRKKIAQGGVVIFTAAQANQRAFPIQLHPGEFRGALSYVFNETQRQDLPTLGELKKRIAQQIAQLKTDKRLNPEPVPTFEVFGPATLEDQPLFGAAHGAHAAQVLTPGNPNSPIKLTLAAQPNRHQFKLGEKFTYQVTSNTAGYLYLLVFSEENIATCLLPNPDLKHSPLAVSAAQQVIIPRLPDKPYVAIEPLGKDIAIALLSKTPLALGEKERYTWDEIFERLRNQDFFKLVKNRQAEPLKRGVGTQKNAAALGAQDWQAVSLVLETIP